MGRGKVRTVSIVGGRQKKGKKGSSKVRNGKENLGGDNVAKGGIRRYFQRVDGEGRSNGADVFKDGNENLDGDGNVVEVGEEMKTARSDLVDVVEEKDIGAIDEKVGQDELLCQRSKTEQDTDQGAERSVGLGVKIDQDVTNEPSCLTIENQVAKRADKEDASKAQSTNKRDPENADNQIQHGVEDTVMDNSNPTDVPIADVDMDECPEPPGTFSGSEDSDSKTRDAEDYSAKNACYVPASDERTMCGNVVEFSVPPKNPMLNGGRVPESLTVGSPFPTLSLGGLKDVVMTIGTPITPEPVPASDEQYAEKMGSDSGTEQKSMKENTQQSSKIKAINFEAAKRCKRKCGKREAVLQRWRSKIRKMARKRVQDIVLSPPRFTEELKTDERFVPNSNTEAGKLHPFFQKSKPARDILVPEVIDVDSDTGSVIDLDSYADGNAGIRCKRAVVQLDLGSDSEDIPASRNARKRPRSAPKQYHPFFNPRSAGASCQSVEVVKITLPNDAWENFHATKSIGHEAPAETRESSTKEHQYSRKMSLQSLKAPIPMDVAFRILEKGEKPEPRRRVVVSTKESCSSEAWSEKYRKMHDGLSTIHGFQLQRLVAWLRKWYEDTPRSVERLDNGEANDDNTDCYTSDSESEVDQRRSQELVALLSGPVGVGKSSMVYQAAEKLGLDVMEINASNCRTGKYLKDTLKEAMSTHRFNNGRNEDQRKSTKHMQNKGCNTLILFEEVDHIYDDEKGFWSSVVDLVLASESKRPLVMTANRFTPAMQSVFGHCPSDKEQELSCLLTSTSRPKVVVPQAFNFSPVVVQRPTKPQIQAALRYVLRSENMNISKEILQLIADMHDNGDLRSAINLLQFWSQLPDEKVGELPSSWATTSAIVGVELLPGNQRHVHKAVAEYPSIMSEIACDQWDGSRDLPILRPTYVNSLTDGVSTKGGSEGLGTWAERCNVLSEIDCFWGETCMSVDNNEERDDMRWLRPTVNIATDITSLIFTSTLSSATKETPTEVNIAGPPSRSSIPLQPSLHEAFRDINKGVPTKRAIATEYFPTLRCFARSEQERKDKELPQDQGKRRSRRHRRLSYFHHLRLGAATQQHFLSPLFDVK